MFELTLTDTEFSRIQTLVYDQCRINLGENKRNLVKARLAKRLRATGYTTYGTYVDYVTSGSQGARELVLMLDAISTNKTSFFRENDHFDYLAKEVLPELYERKRKGTRPRLRIWSSACSSGEEPYTLGMTVLETLGSLATWDAKILGTDISTQVLARAIEGVYHAEAVEPVPALFRQKYLARTGRNGQTRYSVTQALRQLVAFRRLNLSASSWPFRGKFDVIFCRNVMIYFDKPTQGELVRKFYNVLEPSGYLFIGHSESLVGVESEFRRLRPTVYQRAQ